MKTEIKKILYKFLQDGISSDDATQQVLDLFSVSSMFSAEQMEQAFNDGIEAEQQRCGEFDIENYC
jgi:hypothetical protein